MTQIPCTYDPVSKAVSFTVSHFSLYMVGVVSPWENPFADVSKSDWFYDAVRFVSEKGLMTGTGDTAFSPQANTTRGMIVTILYRLEGAPAASANSFSDVAAGKYYTNAVAWAAENKIVGGYGNGKFGPEDAITREQMSVILKNYAKYKGYDVSGSTDLSKYTDGGSVSVWAKDAVSWTTAVGLIQGDGEKLTPSGNAVRCQVAAILQRFIENVAK
ncbi:MAG: S-layer homology domain-containing protein [Clostridiaceae bacterium]|nr:S-layer homology domain-containing protein [Clostridiaceae bacterium]